MGKMSKNSAINKVFSMCEDLVLYHKEHGYVRHEEYRAMENLAFEYDIAVYFDEYDMPIQVEDFPISIG